MNFVGRRRRAFLGITGCLFLLVSLAIIYLWSYRLAPERRALDPNWCRLHSAEAYWAEVQKSIRRAGWPCGHGGLDIAAYADKSVVEWLLSRLFPEANLDCLGADFCHAGLVLSEITNQDHGRRGAPWLEWWKNNGSRTQEEWVSDGFTKYGVSVHLPPAPEDVEPLLCLLGNTSTNETDRIPSFVKHNAFRWLRDSGFDPVGFAVSNPAASATIKDGLFAYFKRDRFQQRKDRAGILSFGIKTDPHPYPPFPPMLLTPWVKAAAYALIVIPFILGSMMLWLSFSKR
jgi:hypothetical protein